ncbi:MAG: hypothetical protein J1E78_07210 [Muribaculaceae bacterium]|nr:hypothetical protein [Muribaculaceae bacterium]
MSENNKEQRSGCSKPVALFLLIAAIIVAAFLIIGLVRTCTTDHQEKQQDAMQDHISMIASDIEKV